MPFGLSACPRACLHTAGSWWSTHQPLQQSLVFSQICLLCWELSLPPLFLILSSLNIWWTFSAVSLMAVHACVHVHIHMHVQTCVPKMAGTGLAKSMTHEIKLSWYEISWCDWLASLLLSCEALDELLNLSEPLFPPLKTGRIIVSTSENCCMVSLRTYRKHLAQSRCWADSCIILV